MDKMRIPIDFVSPQGMHLNGVRISFVKGWRQCIPAFEYWGVSVGMISLCGRI